MDVFEANTIFVLPNLYLIRVCREPLSNVNMDVRIVINEFLGDPRAVPLPEMVRNEFHILLTSTLFFDSQSYLSTVEISSEFFADWNTLD